MTVVFAAPRTSQPPASPEQGPDPRWTDAEAHARGEDSVHEEARVGLRRIRRTKHHIIFTNSSGGNLFAKKMEEFHKRVRKVLPFDERDGRRLMPAFLFCTKEQYVDFPARNTRMSPLKAAQPKGHAYKDYYATWYESPNDPVHIHEATHQILSNRPELPGGGSW